MPGIPDRHTKRASFFFPFCPPDGILITNLEKVKPLPHPGSHRKELSMKLISWNVNGLRACMQKGFAEFFTASDADIFCIQESKLQEGQIDFAPEGYYAYWNYAQKKGYSGTAIFTRKEPLSVHYGIGIPQHDTEGRVITLEFPDFYMVTCYTPNSQNELARLSYRMEWEDAFLSYLKGLDRNKPLILCGDLNVAHEEIDLKNSENQPEKRRFYRRGAHKNDGSFYPPASPIRSAIFIRIPRGIYSWWSYRFHAREKNAGWRIDYFITSSALDDRLVDAGILTDVTGSDHCPVTLTVDLPFCP